MPNGTSNVSLPQQRLPELDQFRGYTVLAMMVVNFLGGLQNVWPNFLHHHTFCSFADTIMPQFLFAVGFGLRLSYLRRAAQVGASIAHRQILQRGLALVLLGCVVYHLTGQYKTWAELTAVPWPQFLLNTIKRGPFEALTHIGVTALWVLPVLSLNGWWRAGFAIVSGALHVWLSLVWYYDWNMTAPAGIDGGPLGFLTWAIPCIAGTLAYDWATTGQGFVWKLFLCALALMGTAIGLSLAGHPDATLPFLQPAEKPAPGYWLMSQRAGSVPYPLFGAGFAALVYLLWFAVSQYTAWQWQVLNLLGRHALAAYLVHDMVAGLVKPFVPKDSPTWYVTIALLVYLALVSAILRFLDRNKLVLKL